jgi:ATP-dependent protease HslVU (ClpYQ) peptidase subunit
MTCIAGLVHDGKVYMGGDSAAVAGYSVHTRTEPKVFRNGGLLFGFTTSFRMGQLLRYELAVPERHDRHDGLTYMVRQVVPAVKACFRAGGFEWKRYDADYGGCFLVGHGGTLYLVDDDYHVGVPRCGYAAVGCGWDLALGSLYSTGDREPRARVLTALKAAEEFSAGVRGPFTVRSL